MSDVTTQTETAMLALFAQHNFARAETSLLQPVDAFLELSGEDIRRRLYLTSDANGTEMCLRPEYTIPVASAYIASSTQGERAEYSYCGPVFRHRIGENGEFVQAGVESFARDDLEAADGETLSLALETARLMGFAEPKLRMGDVAIIEAVLTSLNVPAPQHRKLLRALASGRPYAEALVNATNAAPKNGLSGYSGVLTALKGTDPSEARVFVKDLLSIAGINSVGGRSTADIAERFLSQADGVDVSLSAEARMTLDAFLALEGDPDEVSASLRALAKGAGLELGDVIDRFDARIGFIAAQGVDVTGLTMQTRFVRSLDYYTSFIFEIAGHAPGKPAIAGGRYDRLLGRLGATKDIPAVGFSVWPDRGGAA